MTYRPPRPAGPSTTERGLGWAHQRDRAVLLRGHVDGTPCPCLELNDCGPACPCRRVGIGLPMYRDPARNADGRALQADHSRARSRGGTRADRLLLATCNASRGDGSRRRQQPATGRTLQLQRAPRPATLQLQPAAPATTRDWFDE